MRAQLMRLLGILLSAFLGGQTLDRVRLDLRWPKTPRPETTSPQRAYATQRRNGAHQTMHSDAFSEPAI